MRVNLVHEGHKPHQIKYLSAMADGMRSHGVSVDISGEFHEADVCAVWGAKDVPKSFERVLRLEAGYINGASGDYIPDRLRFISLSWGLLHGRSTPPPDCPGDRWRSLKIKLRRWHVDKTYRELCCLNHPNDLTAPKHKWWLDYPGAIIRKHPLIVPDQEPLFEALARASACITWNSSAGIESVIAGVPTVALDAGSMVYALSNGKDYFDRKQWAHNLAYRQWTLAELQSGEAWEFARYGLETNQHHESTDRQSGASVRNQGSSVARD